MSLRFDLLADRGFQKIIFAILSAWVLLPFSIENENTILFIFVSFLPFFYLADKIRSTRNYVLVAVIASLIYSIRWYLWIIDSGYYLKFALLILFNSILYLIPLMVLRYKSIYWFIVSWICIELFHIYTPVGSPITVIGNYLSFGIDFFQWYEITGVLGGSLYVLVVNWAIWNWIKNGSFRLNKQLALVLALVFSSVVISFLLKPEDTDGDIEVFALGTDLNARAKKYRMKESEVLKQYIDTTINSITPKTQLIIWPETALFTLKNIESEKTVQYYNEITKRLRLGESCNLVTGAVLKEFFFTHEMDRIPPDLMPSISKNQYFRTYNSVLKLPSDSIVYRNKERLVPFNEYQPDNIIGRLLFDIDKKNRFKFSKFRLGKQIFSIGSEIKLLPLICFESLFGPDVIRNSREANLISVSLNEGWYDSKRGSKLFNQFAICRAVENRRCVITSSNCGYSSIINQSGYTELAQRGQSKLGYVKLSNKVTIFSYCGNFLVIFILLLLGLFKKP